MLMEQKEIDKVRKASNEIDSWWSVIVTIAVAQYVLDYI